MAKSKKRINTKYLTLGALIATIFAIAAVVMFTLLPMVSTHVSGTIFDAALKGDTTYQGAGLIFSGSYNSVTVSSIAGNSMKTNGTGSIEKINVMALCAFIALVLGALGEICSLFAKNKLKKPLVVLSGLIIIVGGVMIFFTKSSVIKLIFGNNAESIMKYAKLSYGAIISGIVASLGGLIGIALPIVKK